MKEREGAKRSKSGKKYPEKTSNAVLAKRLPDKMSILVLTKCLPDKTSKAGQS